MKNTNLIKFEKQGKSFYQPQLTVTDTLIVFLKKYPLQLFSSIWIKWPSIERCTPPIKTLRTSNERR